MTEPRIVYIPDDALEAYAQGGDGEGMTAAELAALDPTVDDWMATPEQLAAELPARLAAATATTLACLDYARARNRAGDRWREDGPENDAAYSALLAADDAAWTAYHAARNAERGMYRAATYAEPELPPWAAARLSGELGARGEPEA